MFNCCIDLDQFANKIRNINRLLLDIEQQPSAQEQKKIATHWVLENKSNNCLTIINNNKVLYLFYGIFTKGNFVQKELPKIEQNIEHRRIEDNTLTLDQL